MNYFIRSAHSDRTLDVVEASDERDALSQYIRGLSYEPDLSEATDWNGHVLVVVENDEVFAVTAKPHPANVHGVLVPCANCGRDIHVPREEVERELVSAMITCSHDCMTAVRGRSS